MAFGRLKGLTACGLFEVFEGRCPFEGFDTSCLKMFEASPFEGVVYLINRDDFNNVFKNNGDTGFTSGPIGVMLW